MQLTTPIYERVPQMWFLLGLLFMSSGTYLGFDYSLTFLYFGVGLICAAWSMWICLKRAVVKAIVGVMAPAEASESAPTPAPAQASVAPPATTDPQAELAQHESQNQGAGTPA